MQILVGFDGSNLSKRAADAARQQAKLIKAKVHLVFSHSGEHQRAEDFEAAKNDLDYAAGLFKEEGLECETHILVRGLDSGEDLVGFAREKNVDMIVVGVRIRSKVSKMIFGSTTQHVVLHAHCPVLTVK